MPSRRGSGNETVGKDQICHATQVGVARLVEALHRWAAVAALCDPVSRVKYASLRASGDFVITGLFGRRGSPSPRHLPLLDKGELFDKEFKKPTQAEAA